MVNHFPNVHVPTGSELYETTRIVRIPRTYHTTDYSYMVPQFSVYTPGEEPAAVLGEPTLGEFDGNVFGTTSKPPLVPLLLSAKELEEIVRTVNGMLEEAFSMDSKWTWMDNVLEFLSGTVYSRVWGRFFRELFTKRKMEEVDMYIEKVNGEFLGRRDGLLRVVPLGESGLMSLDVQIPKP